MAFDAGTIIAHLDVDLQKAKAKLDDFERDVERAGRDRKVRLGAVFEQADLTKGRRLLADFDRQISRDAAQRMRSDPNGSVLGALNALFSPHQIAGAPTPQQSARSGALGRVAAATAAEDITGGGGGRFSFSRLFGRDLGRAVGQEAGAAAGAEAGKALADATGGGGGRGGFLRSLFGGGNFGSRLLGGVGPGILGVSTRNAGIVGLGGSLLGALPALLGGLSPLLAAAPGLAGLGILAKSSLSSVMPLNQLANQIQSQQAAGLGSTASGAKQIAQEQQQLAAGVAALPKAQQMAFRSLQSIGNAWQGLTQSFAPVMAKALGSVAQLFKGLLPDLKSFFSASAQLIGPLIGGLGDIAKGLLPLLTAGIRAAVPVLRPLLDGFGKLLSGIFPGLIALVKSSAPAVKVLAQILGSLGHDLGSMFAAFAPVIRSSSVILKSLFDVLGAVFPLVGHLAAIFAKALAPAFSVFASVVRAILPVLKILGTILAEFAGAVLGDLSAAFGAIADLLKGITPSLNILARVLGQVFKTLENAGVFAVLGDALEGIARPLARLINAIVIGLAPILPVVTRLISSLSGVVINLLVKAIDLLVPIAIQLVNDALKPLLPVVKALVPVLISIAQIIGSGLGDVLKVIAPILAKLAPYILAVVLAMKAWAIIQGILNIALDANPIGLIALAIGALIIAVVELVKHWKAVWGFIKSIAEDAWNFLTHGWGQFLVPGITVIRLAVAFLRDHWKQIWGDIKTVAMDIWDWLRQTFGTDLANFFTKTIPGWWDTAVNLFNTDFVDPWKQALSDLWTWVWTDFGQKIASFFTKTIPGWISTGVSILGRAWSAIENAVRGPVDWVITHVINDGLIAAFDWISSKVGGPHIDPVKGFARGGKLPGYGGGDRRLILAEDGETVVDKDRTRLLGPLFALLGIPGFQGGGKVGSGLSGKSGGGGGGIFGKIFDAGKIIAAIATGNTTALTHAFEALFGISAGGAVGDLAAMLLDIPRTLVGDAVKFLIGQLGGSAGGGISGNVNSYRGLVLKVLGMLGQPAGDLGTVLSQMTTESGGNATIVNKWDSNWIAGHPSVGLMQVIAGTFDAFAGPFRNVGPFLYGVSTNPLANIYAGLNYAIHRYGAGWTSVLGHGHGYDNGGWMQPGLSWNLTGGREAVLTPGQSNAFVTMAQVAEWWRKRGGDGGSGVRDVYLTLPEGTTVSQALNELDFQLKVSRMQGTQP